MKYIRYGAVINFNHPWITNGIKLVHWNATKAFSMFLFRHLLPLMLLVIALWYTIFNFLRAMANRIKLDDEFKYYPTLALQPWIINCEAEINLVEVVAFNNVYFTQDILTVYQRCKQLNWDFFNEPYTLRFFEQNDLVFEQKGPLYIDGIIEINTFNKAKCREYAIRTGTENTIIPLEILRLAPTSLYYYGGLPYTNYVTDSGHDLNYYYTNKIKY